MIKFEKVSFEQFKADCDKLYNYWWSDDELRKFYDNIKLPVRATKGSAGYDFYFPLDKLNIHPTRSAVIPTGIKCNMDKDVVLMIYPRSGHGFKYGIELANTCGIIDSDYINSDNEGHIMVKLVNKDFSKYDLEDILDLQDVDDYYNLPPFTLKQGDKFCQGIFVNYLTTTDDVATDNRNGGLGSTDKS